MNKMQNLMRVRSVQATFRCVLIISIAAVLGCGSPKEETKTRGLNDIENALKVIRDRQESEERIINDQLKQIEVLEGNIEKSKTDGMKDHIRKDIEMKKLAIEKARKNIANQDVILKQLEMKKDSMERAGD